MLNKDLLINLCSLLRIEDLCALRETHSCFSFIPSFQIRYQSFHEKINLLACERFFETQIGEVVQDPQEYWIQFLDPKTNLFLTVKHIAANRCSYIQIATNLYLLDSYLSEYVGLQKGWGNKYCGTNADYFLKNFGTTFIGYQGRKACPPTSKQKIYYYEFELDHLQKVLPELLSLIVFNDEIDQWITYEIHSSTMFYQMLNQSVSNIHNLKVELVELRLNKSHFPDLRYPFVTKDTIRLFLLD